MTGFVTPGTLAADAAADPSVVFYAVGICHASACCDSAVSVDDVLDAANRRWPTGLDHGWMISTDETFLSGEPNPCPCEQTPGRVHRLLEC